MEIQEFNGYMKPMTCVEIMRAVEPHLTPAMCNVGEERKVSMHRLADNCKVSDAPWVKPIRQFVSERVGTSLDNVENVEVVRYPEGGYFMNHHDGEFRSHTFVVYLNAGYSGGELFFSKIGKLYKSIPIGTALLWENTSEAYHECRRVENGEKWCLSVWVRRSRPQDSLW